MTALLLAALAAAGVSLLMLPTEHHGVAASGADGVGPFRRLLRRTDERIGRWLRQAGGLSVTPLQFLLTSTAAAVIGTAATSSVLGFGIAAVLLGLIIGTAPGAVWRRRRAARRRAASEAWPRLIEELRVLTGPAGRPIPQALLEVGLRGPTEVRPAFVAAQREWAMSTDVSRMMAVLKRELADPVADATCETLLIAVLAGGDVDDRLAALAEDRRSDERERKEAHAKQAGARLARGFVVIVPAGMALAGLNVGDGSNAYRTPQGQVLVAGAVALVAACWWWATRIMRIPEARRVLDR